VTVRLLVAAVIFGVALTMSPIAGATEPVAAVPHGNVEPALDSVRGKVAVAASGAPVDDRVAVIVENGTTRPARVKSVTATATRGGGATATRARTVATYPRVLAPGGYALAVVKFPRDGAPAGATMQFRVASRQARSSTDRRALVTGDFVLSPPMTGAVAQTLGATVTNPSRARTARAPRAVVMCFNEARKPVTLTTTRLDVAELGPTRSAPVSVRLTTLCPAYVVAASAGLTSSAWRSSSDSWWSGWWSASPRSS